MAHPFWPKALSEACLHTSHPGLHTCTEESIVMYFLWRWGSYPVEVWPRWERVFHQGRDDDHFEQNIFPLLQRAATEGEKEDRVFALFLLGGLATSEAKDLLFSFVTSGPRKERWASALALGRLKDERAFAFLQTMLLEGFFVFAEKEELQKAQETCKLYRRTCQEQESYAHPNVCWDLLHFLQEIDYEWYLRQRSECALILGAWGNPVVVPKLCEALQAAWKMEQDWPDYLGPELGEGPTNWYFFQDNLVFALGQLGAWDALSPCPFPEKHLLVARIYLILGALQTNDSSIPYNLHHVFRQYPTRSCNYDVMKNVIVWKDTTLEVHPLVESAPIKQLLAEHFALSESEQEDYLLRCSQLWYERATESGFTPLPSQWKESGLRESPDVDLFDPFLDAEE